MVIKRMTLLKMVLVLVIFAAGFWGAGERVKSVQKGKVLSATQGQNEGGVSGESGKVKDSVKPVASSILGGDDKKSPIPSKVPNFVPAFTASADINSNSIGDEPFNRKVYEGQALAGAAEKKELLRLNFDSGVTGWEKKVGDPETKVGGKSGQGILIDSGKYTLNRGQTFAASGSVSFWLKLENIDANYGEIPVLDWNFDDSSNSYQPSLFEVSYIRSEKCYLSFSIYDDESNQDDIGAELQNPTEWHKIDVNWDLTSKPFRRVLYIDGSKAAEGDFPIAPKTKDQPDFTVGGSLGGRAGGKFIVDEVVMVNWAKSEEEMKNEL